MTTVTIQPQRPQRILPVGLCPDTDANRLARAEHLAVVTSASAKARSTVTFKPIRNTHHKDVSITNPDPFSDDALEWGWLG